MVPLVVAGKVSRGRGLVALVVVVLAAPAIISTATFLSWVNIAAGPSLRKHHQETVDQSSAALSELREARQREVELRTVLGETSDSMLRLAQDEEGHGGLSSKTNKGPISLALYRLGSTYADAKEILDKDDREAHENFAEAERVLSTMRDLLTESTAQHERTDDVNARFAQETFRLSRLLADLKKSPLRSVLAVVRKSDTTIAFLPARRDSPQETSAKAALIKLAGESKSRIDRLAEGADRSSLTLPRFEMMSRQEASFAYMKSFIEYPIICLTVDLIVPLVGLFVLVFFAPGRAGDQPVAVQGDQVPVAVSDDATDERRRDDNAQRIVEALRRRSARPADLGPRNDGITTKGSDRRGANGASRAADGGAP
ncbi:MAG: hypothetical protein IT377_07295 [Polyangiaceae bacterium]|nr:hypothetical protein [Polyangiaceae bacterium]